MLTGRPFLARSATGALVALMAAACGGGGGGSPATPSPTPAPTGVNACGVVGGAASLSLVPIINGAACSPAVSPVAMLQLRDADNRFLGMCSGTVIAPRAVLTAAHCLDEETIKAGVYFGSGLPVLSVSIHRHPSYREGSATSLDIGVVLLGEDLNRPTVPLLTSREAQVGEQAVIAGWGKDDLDVTGTLRAGTTNVAAAGAYFLESRYTASSSGTSGVCAGDSGGPLLLSQDGVWVLAGVTSAISSQICTSGTSFYANLRHPDAQSFVFGLVPDAGRR